MSSYIPQEQILEQIFLNEYFQLFVSKVENVDQSSAHHLIMIVNSVTNDDIYDDLANVSKLRFQ